MNTFSSASKQVVTKGETAATIFEFQFYISNSSDTTFWFHVLGGRKGKQMQHVVFFFFIFLEQRVLVSELNTKVNQMLDSRLYLVRACAQSVFFI